MAWHLRYTSAATGPTGRSGFQFVAVTPDTPNELIGSVAPYMTYRPPPTAPLAPEPDELAQFPVSMAYDRVGEYGVLVCCQYTGRDYSGRYGNFLGHAVAVTAAEMEGMRPIEFWRSPMWTDAGPDDDPIPGDALDPELLAEWVAARDDDGLLAALVDAVGAVLHRGHGRIVLIAEDVELIARWIAIVSYSLPLRLAAKLSFVTYSADPDAAPQFIVGTTPDCWTPSAGEVRFRLDEPHPSMISNDSVPVPSAFSTADRGDLEVTGRGYSTSNAKHRRTPVPAPSDIEPPARFGKLIADRWRAADLGGIDEISELAALAGDFRAAGALASLCAGDETVTEDEESAVAALIRGERHEMPPWVWSALLATVPYLRLELAVALWEAAADPELTDRCAERCVELALADPDRPSPLPPGLRSPDGLPAAFEAAIATADDLVELARIVALADQLDGTLTPESVTAAAATLAGGTSGTVRVPPTRPWPGEGAPHPAATPNESRTDPTPPDRTPRTAHDQPGTHPATDDQTSRSSTDRHGSAPPSDDIAGGTPGTVRVPPTGSWPGEGAPHPAATPNESSSDTTPPDRNPGTTNARRGSAGRTSGTVRVPPTGSWPGEGAPHRAVIQRALGMVPERWRADFSTGVINGLVEADRLEDLWDGPPKAGECARLIRRLRPDQHDAAHRVLRSAFERVPLDDPETIGLAELVVATPSFVDTVPRAAAELVLDHERALRATEPVLLARLLTSIEAGIGVVKELGLRGFLGVSAELARRGPQTQADVAAAAEPAVRTRLIKDWLAVGDRADLAELAVRLRWVGASDPLLDEWAKDVAGKRFGRRQLQSTLADRDPRLAEGWREIAGDRRRGDG